MNVQVVEQVSQWTPFQSLIFVGGVGGGVTFLVWLYRGIRNWWAGTADYSLEYSPFQTILSGTAREVVIEARCRLFNPHDATIRLRAIRMLTTFNDVSEDSAEGRNVQLDIAPKSEAVYVHSRPMLLRRDNPRETIGGRIDWSFMCGKVEKNGTVHFGTPLTLRGNLDVHFFNHGPESRWGPDPDISAPIFELDQVDRNDEGNEIHLRPA